MRVCREISRWVNENVERPIEEWINRTERQCVEQPRWRTVWLVRFYKSLRIILPPLAMYMI
jgi:hypothetical protein